MAVFFTFTHTSKKKCCGFFYGIYGRVIYIFIYNGYFKTLKHLNFQIFENFK